ncbi:hypothetical protein LUZ61_019756 [Rhynchospora tenuis]|uniref:Uncharacterized protein n=1 Tax=Rhynchospora tenuis TaxID=198213 RepID=A0AAD5ZBR6_9POAL|nr:hypothetical protein LUZ61_019756 [Rhynchospora tenuis]
MAMILQAFVGNISSRLTKMAADEVGMLLGIPGEIEKLGNTVRDIQCVLSDAERKQINSSAIQRWLMELKDVMYDAEDLIDTWQIKTEDSVSSSKSSRSVSLISSVSNTKFAHEIGIKIKELNSRLDEISKKKSDLGLNELLEDVRPDKHRRTNSDISLKTDPSIVLADIVGEKIEEDTKLMVKWLTTEEMGVTENVSAVAIVGMPGIGKTTLAKKIFNDQRIQEEFYLKFWVCVSKDLKGVELLKCIIREAGGHHGAAEERSELVPMLERLVRGKKFFLVLDDVWHESQIVWDELLRAAMISGARGSRLLVTTRDGNVARFMKAKKSLQVDKLPDDDGWSLLIKQVGIDQTESKILNDIGVELVTKCHGLPLAIKTIGGVLRGKDKSTLEWEKVLRSNLWSTDDLSSDFNRAFHLSYEDLPPHLKQCFIICSLYPEDFEYTEKQLVYLWLAEGFLCAEGTLSFSELGREYYNELILRNLLEVVPGWYNRAKCKMHDLLRSFAGHMGKGENLTTRGNKLSHKSESWLKLRRLSIEQTTVNLDFFKKEKSLRTLLLIKNSMGDVLSNMLLYFPHLRVIDLAESNITSLSDSFCDLVLLRFLRLSGLKLQSLPNSIGNLRRLEFLSLTNCEQLSHIPSSIFDLHDLRYLSFYNTNIKVLPMGLRKLKKLVVLHGFKSYDNISNDFSSLEDFGTMNQISCLSLDSFEKSLDVTAAKRANFKDKVHLKRLQFFYTPNQGSHVPTIEEKKSAEDVLNELRPPLSLEIFAIKGYLGHQLPNWLHVGTDPSNLKFLRYLDLTNCECFSQLPPLGQLPNLDLLRIKGAISVTKIGRGFLLDDDKDHIRTEVTYSSILPFAQLNGLEFERMLNWIEWLWEEDQPAMPKLKNLFIQDCPELSSLPKGLSHHATSLEILRIIAAKQIKSVENLQSIKELHVLENPNLDRISNLSNLSFIQIRDCPSLKILENLKPFHRMELSDILMETLPEYLITSMPEKLTIWCKNELLVKITSQGIGDTEWKKFKHIPMVKIYSNNQSLYAEYRKSAETFSFTTNVDQQNEKN